MNLITDPISTSNPVLTCKVNEKSLVADESESFSVTVTLIDSFSSVTIPNITWENYTWTASISTVALSKCQSNRTTLNSSSTPVVFDPSTGIATFSNLRINSRGMYILLISVETKNSNNYNFVCWSSPIIIKTKSVAILTEDLGREPNFFLTFTGNYSRKSGQQLKEFESLVYNCLLQPFGLVLDRAIIIYSGSVKSVLSTSGSADSYANLIAELNATNYTLGGEFLTAARIQGTEFSYRSSETPISVQDQASQDQSKNDLTIGLVVGLIGGLLLIIILSIVGLILFKNYMKKNKLLYPEKPMPAALSPEPELPQEPVQEPVKIERKLKSLNSMKRSRYYYRDFSRFEQ
jgi:hypothetical protein